MLSKLKTIMLILLRMSETKSVKSTGYNWHVTSQSIWYPVENNQ
jgi:hypothetical protein